MGDVWLFLRWATHKASAYHAPEGVSLALLAVWWFIVAASPGLTDFVAFVATNFWLVKFTITLALLTALGMYFCKE